MKLCTFANRTNTYKRFKIQLMKKILLSIVALMAMAFSASAAEPTYTAWACSSSMEEWETKGYTEFVSDLNNLQVEVYGTDSIIIRNWYGAGQNSAGNTYDLVCVLTDGHISSFYTSVGGVSYPYYGTYVYPGPSGYTDASGFDPYLAYLTPYTTGYEDFTQYESDADTKTGEMILYGTIYNSDYTKSKAGYYHLTWSPEKKVVPTYTAYGQVTNNADWDAKYKAVLTDITNLDVEVYGSDSIIVRNFAGYENYDLVAVLGENNSISKCYGYRDGSKFDYYNYVYSGAEAASEIYNIYFYTLSGYNEWESDETTKTGSLICYVSTYDSKYTGGTNGYYYITWSPEKTTTGISSVTAKAENDNAPMYNLAGQRVSKNAKGLVIKNGKKMILK